MLWNYSLRVAPCSWPDWLIHLCLMNLLPVKNSFLMEMNSCHPLNIYMSWLVCRSAILKDNQDSKKKGSTWKTIICIHRCHFVRDLWFRFWCILIVFEEGGIRGNASSHCFFRYPDKHKAETASATRQNIFCVSSQLKQAKGDLWQAAMVIYKKLSCVK